MAPATVHRKHPPVYRFSLFNLARSMHSFAGATARELKVQKKQQKKKQKIVINSEVNDLIASFTLNSNQGSIGTGVKTASTSAAIVTTKRKRKGIRIKKGDVIRGIKITNRTTLKQAERILHEERKSKMET